MNHEEAQLNRFRLSDAGTKAFAVTTRHQFLDAIGNRQARHREMLRIRKELEAAQDALVLAYEACIALHESLHKDIMNLEEGRK